MAPPPPRPPPPVPKPRSRFSWSSSSSAPSQDRDSTDQHPQLEAANRAQALPDEAPPPVNLPTLESVTDIIINSIPSLAGIAAALAGPTPSAPSAPPAPPSIDSITSNIAANIPALADAASIRANPDAAAFVSTPLATPVADAPVANVPAATTPTAKTGAASFDRVMSSLANIPGMSEIISGAGNPSSSTSPSAPPIPGDRPRPDGDANTGDGITVLSCWTSQEEADTESSTEEEDTGLNPALAVTDSTMGGDAGNKNISINQQRPVRPAPPPPRKPSKSGKHKIPRVATIRVSRKKGDKRSSPQSTVVRASWLDVWKGFRHSVLWVTLDGQLMSLWKKRTDRFSEVLLHVSSITNVKKQDKGRFSVYIKKKHYDFMAHSDEVQEGWVTSLLACRGQQSPAPSELHGPITMKEPRSRAYMALWGHDLWIYPSKDGFQLGVASFRVPLNVASVKPTGKHSLSLITPYKSFSLSVDSSKELSVWVDRLSSTIHSALSCSQVALRLWENPDNKVCADCGAANPDWASINLLLVICHECAGHHRALGSNLSKVRSMTMDSKVWTEPLIQLFLAYGNWLANQVWAPVVPGAETLRPESSSEERSKFIEDKYRRGRFRRVHALSSSPSMMEQRLLQVVCTDDVEETMSLICSGVKVCPIEPQNPSPILLAEKANQALQIELLRLNEYTEIPVHQPPSANTRTDSTSGEEEEELHGKLEEDRFLFSMENDSAACDVLDLREVQSVFIRDSHSQEFELVTLIGNLICTADDREGLMTHLLHILKVIFPSSVSSAEMDGICAVSKVYVVGVGEACVHWEAWLLLWEGGVSVHPAHSNPPRDALRSELSEICHHEIDSSGNIITMATADRSMPLRFEESYSCHTWFKHLSKALTNHSMAPQQPSGANHNAAPKRPVSASHSLGGLYPVIDVGSRGSVPPAIERCISHITAYGLKIEGVYRRCGIASKVTRLVEALMTSPKTAPLESDEQGVLDAGSALKQFVRQTQALVPPDQKRAWLQAAVFSDEQSRFKEYRKVLRQLPEDNRATLNALFGHFYMIQVFSQVNKMSAHNLAVVLVPSLFQALNQDLILLTKEFIIHHTLLFLTPDSGEPEEEHTEIQKVEEEEEEQITIF